MPTDPLSARSDRGRRVDMRPFEGDEVNAAWAEVRKARVERDQMRAALNTALDFFTNGDADYAKVVIDAALNSAAPDEKGRNR